MRNDCVVSVWDARSVRVTVAMGVLFVCDSDKGCVVCARARVCVRARARVCVCGCVCVRVTVTSGA